MKNNQNLPKKYPPNNKKTDDGYTHITLMKKNVPIKENNSTIFNFFRVSSVHKSTSIPIVPETRQSVINLNKDKGKTESKKNYRLSKYDFYKSKKKKNSNIIKKFTQHSEESENKIDVSEFILFNEKFSNEINKIFEFNFIRSFKRYIDDKNKNELNKIGLNQNLNISKTTFNKFLQQIFKNFINKYLLNTYHNLIYVPEKYMMKQNNQSDTNEIGLLSYNDKPNIYLEYCPINLSECNLFYPELCSNITKFIKNFKIKKRKNKPNSALLLYRPNEDFTAYISKIKLICEQLGYRLLIREDEVNKLMNIDKIKEINQNFIIGSLHDKNIKYLKILDNISITEKWTNFLECNNIQINSQNDGEEDKIKQNKIAKNISKSQTTIDMTQSLSNRANKLNLGKNTEKDDPFKLSSKTLTFIGHNSNIISSQESEKTESKEYKIFQNYQQNILEKFNKRRNVILFVDTFEKNEDNIKYINQINTMIPTSKSPIIILTNNLSFFTDNLVIGSTSFQTRYFPYQIENEGIEQKENLIYITCLILYFSIFIPKKNCEKKEKFLNIIVDREKELESEKGMDIIYNINDSDSSSIDNNEKKCILEKIKKCINNIFADTKLNVHNDLLYSSLINLSNIICIINNYEIDNILVYLKNILDLVTYKLKDQNVIQSAKQKIALLQNIILQDIEKYKNEFSMKDGNSEGDISKLSEIYDNNSFLDYEYGSVQHIAERQYEEKIKNYGINKGVNYNKENYFYTDKFCYEYKNSDKFNCISNDEIEERMIEDHKFFQNYYNSNIILNHSDINKINMILCQIILNDRILLEDISKFIGTRFSKRKTSQKQNNNLNNNNLYINEKIGLLNKLFRKCPIEMFSRYMNAHFGIKYFTEFLIGENKYYIPEKLLFFNYYNDYYLMEQIQSEHHNKYKENEEEEEDYEDNEIIDEEEEDDINDEDY